MKINKFTIDSSVLISLIAESDLHYRESNRFMHNISSFGRNTNVVFMMPMIVLFEVFHTLRRKGFLDNPEGYMRFREVFNFSCFKYFDLNFHFFNLFKEIEFFNDLKTSDAIIATSALFTDSVLISWDRKLVSTVDYAYTPEDFLKKFG